MNGATEHAGGAEREILRRLGNIEKKVESLDETSAFAMRFNRDAHRGELDRIFRSGRRRAQVYLAANGRKSVNEIAEALSMQRQNVSIELTKLERAGLLSVASSSGGANYWNKKAIDWNLDISGLLKKKFKLRGDGTPE